MTRERTLMPNRALELLNQYGPTMSDKKVMRYLTQALDEIERQQATAQKAADLLADRGARASQGRSTKDRLNALEAEVFDKRVPEKHAAVEWREALQDLLTARGDDRNRAIARAECALRLEIE